MFKSVVKLERARVPSASLMKEKNVIFWLYEIKNFSVLTLCPNN